MFSVLISTLLLVPGANAVAQPAGGHCVAGPAGAAESNAATQCFGTFREAITFVSGGQITDAPATVRDAAADQGFRERLASVRTAAGNVITATAFDGSNYGGDSLTMVGARPCVKNDRVDWWYDLGPLGWANRISSVQPWANCWIWLYPESGNREGPFKGNTPDVGNYIDNRAIRVGLS
jgi:hypothetical protein